MIQARVSPPEYLEVAALAAALNITVSQMTRESLFERLTEWRKKAKAAQLRKLPHGVLDREVDEAADQLVAAINRGDDLRVPLDQLFGPRSKAVFRLLAAVWQEDPSDVSQKMLDRLAVRVTERLTKKAAAGDASPDTPGDVPADTDSRPRDRVRDYPRRGKR